MSFKAKLMQICLVFCLLLSLASFVFVGAITHDATNAWEVGVWSQVEEGANWSQAVAGGCQIDGGSCSGGNLIGK